MQEEARLQGQAVEIKVGILLIEFPDTTHYTTDSTSNRPHGYFIEDFERMFFSHKEDPDSLNWYKPNPNPPSDPSPHPEHDFVYGSLRDYWWEVSRGGVDSVGALRVVGNVINPPDSLHPEVPEWLMLDSAKLWYDNHGGHQVEAIRKAKLNGWMAGNPDSTFDFPEYDKIVVIYAGRTLFGKKLNPSSAIIGQYFEQKGFWDIGERYKRRFIHIGLNAHEFGHTIGLYDEYIPGGFGGTGDWFDLMSLAAYNGRGNRGGCPALINPYYRIEKYEWTEAIEIAMDTMNLSIVYDYDNPNYYQITTISDTTKYFYIENRRRKSFDLYTPWDPGWDTTRQGGWLLAWKVEETGYSHVREKIEFIPADNQIGYPQPTSASEAYLDFFPKTGLPYQNLTDETLPSTNLKDGSASFVAINNVHKDTLNDKIMRADIYRNYGLLTIADNVTWQGDLTIPEYMVVIDSGGVLNIEPGSNIKFVSRYDTTYQPQIIIKNGGVLNSIGTAQENITINSTLKIIGRWKGIYCENGGQINIQNTSVKYANTALNLEYISNTQFYNLIIDSCKNGMLVSGNNNTFSNCKFSNLDKALEFSGNGNIIDSCTFNGGDISCILTDEQTIIVNSSFENHVILHIRDSNLLSIKNNLFSNSFIEIAGEIEENNCKIENNIMLGKLNEGTAILLDALEGITPSIKNNTIANYQFGLYCIGSIALPTVKNNIFYNNSLTQDFGGNIFGGNINFFTYNDIYNINNAGAPIGTNGNISVDPLFVNTTHDDYHLKGNSPCIDAGNPFDPYSLEPQPNGNRINMGAYGNTPEATHSFDIIVENDLTTNTIWNGYVIVVDDVSTAGNSLTVEPGTKVYFEDGISLHVDAGIHADGSEDSITFRGYRDTDQMYGIILSEPANDCELLFCSFKNARYGLFLDGIQNFQNIFQNLTFQNSETGIYLSRAAAEILNCSFLNNTNGIISQTSNLNLHNSYFKENKTQGLYLFDSVFDVYENTFEDNWIRGVYFQYSSDGNFYKNIVKNNATIAHLVETHLVGGLVFYQSSPYISNNEITDNEAQGIIFMSTSFPMLIEDGFNLISENGQGHGENGPEIKVKDYSFPVIDYGHNDIVDNLGGYLVFGDEDEREGELYIRRNYWGTTDPEEIESRVYRPEGFVFIPYDSIPNTNGGGGEGGQEMFARAATAESDSNYTLAQATFDSVVNIYSATIYGKAALERLYVLKKKNGEDLITIKSYYDGLTNHQDEGIAVLAKRISIRCQTNAAQYITAVSEHQSWQPTMSYVCDSVYSEVDILTNQMLQSGTMFAKSGKSAISTKKEFLNQFSQYQQESEQILSQLFYTTNNRNRNTIPSTYSLSQNYPNPFNPTTTIKYQIPFVSDVKLTIFNILGQHIITLVDENKQPGSYKITWNGKNKYGQQVASGIYVYRLSANTQQKIFENSKKMLLLK